MPENKTAVPHTFTKDGIYYFVRRVPLELSQHYVSSRISYSLRTKSAPVAAARAARAAIKLDEYWYHLRCQNADLPGKHMLRKGGPAAAAALGDGQCVNTDCMLLSEAVLTYLRLKGTGKGVTFHRAAERACGYVIDVCGDKPLHSYTKPDANAFRDSLVQRGMAGSSITRVLGTVRSVINFASSEAGVEVNNPFRKVYFDRSAGVCGRNPMPASAISKIQMECYRVDDELRWLVALVADTGMRLAEAAGLLCEDFAEAEDGTLSVQVRPHPWRRLKTSGSSREIPLVGSAEWAAKRVLAKRDGKEFAFPKYNKTDLTNANAASAALNKWVRPYAPDGATMHGFRHAMRDRLRAVECPSDIVDQLGGWQTQGVGQGYGDGYPIGVLRRWMIKLTL